MASSTQKNPALDAEWLARFKEALSKRGTTTTLAGALGTDESTVSRLKKGYGSVSMAFRASFELGLVPPTALFPADMLPWLDTIIRARNANVLASLEATRQTIDALIPRRVQAVPPPPTENIRERRGRKASGR